MLQQVLWAEVLLKGGIGLLLTLAPGYAIAAAGLPVAGTGFWPRFAGALLLGIAAGLLLQGSVPAVRTIAPAGLISINLCAAALLVGQVVLGKSSLTRRGTVLLCALAAALGLLSLVEVAFA